MLRGFIAALLWFTFDDMLAAATGIGLLGSLPFWPVVGACMFLAVLFGMRWVSTRSSDK